MTDTVCARYAHDADVAAGAGANARGEWGYSAWAAWHTLVYGSSPRTIPEDYTIRARRFWVCSRLAAARRDTRVSRGGRP